MTITNAAVTTGASGYHKSYSYSARLDEAEALCNIVATSWGYPDACGGGCNESRCWWGVAGNMVVPVGSEPGVDGEYRALTVYIEDKQSLSECSVGNPILPSTGTKVQSEIDYQSDDTLPLQVKRTFISTIPESGDQQLWRWQYGNQWQLDPQQGEGRAVARHSNGRSIHFSLQPNGEWSADQGTTLTLSKDASDWLLSNYVSNRVERYNAAGNIVQITQHGQQLDYTYGTNTAHNSPNLVISDSFGKSVEIVFGENGQPSKLIDPAGDVTHYAYNADQSIEFVYYPDDTSWTLSDNPMRQYHYEESIHPSWKSKYLLTGITDERGVRVSTWEYARIANNPGFRATSSEHAGVDRYEVSGMDALSRVTTTNPLGKDTVLQFTELDGVKRLTSIEGVATANCVASTQSIEYDAVVFLIIPAAISQRKALA